jgi:hydrogenase 3 maturation protease
MLRKSWQPPLRQTLRKLQRVDRPVRVAVVGIGNELRGDDAAGVALAHSLERFVKGNENLLVICAGPAPENCTSQLRHFAPDCVLLLDAAHMGEKPGKARWISWEQASGFSASTHSLPLSLYGSYLTKELGCEVVLLGIQPASIKVDTQLSSTVKASVELVAESLANILLDGQATGGLRGRDINWKSRG